MTLPETLRAAFVIARRDFTATVFSKTFLLFLLGPLFPVVLGVMFGGIGEKIDADRKVPQVALVGSARSSRYQSALNPFSSAVPRMNCHTPRAFARDSADGLNALSISGM